MNLRELLARSAGQYGEKVALVSGKTRITYAGLEESSNRVTGALRGLGVTRGDRVAFVLPNSPEYVVLYFGVVKLGAIAVLLDVKYKASELASFCSNCQPKIIIAQSPHLEAVASARDRFPSVEHLIELAPEPSGRFLTYEQLLASGTPLEVEVPLAPGDIASLLYTSYASSRPRGTMMSHKNTVQESIISGEGFRQTEEDMVLLYALPLHHVFGLTITLLNSLYRGSTVAMAGGSLGEAFEAVRRHRATMFMGVPYIYALANSLAERGEIPRDLGTLRLCGSAGAVLPVDTILRFQRNFGHTIIDLWGLSEALGHCTCQPADGSGKLGSIGKALPGWEVRVVDDDGRGLAPDRTGELVVRGPIMSGYYHNPEATLEVIRDGWLYTGDYGRIDEDGYVFFVGLKKNMMIVKGQNVYPSDVEEVLSRHPQVAETAVLGFPDPMRGEVVRAVVSLKDGLPVSEMEIRQYCREYLADYKVPKQVLFVPTLPRSPEGRLSKEHLRSMPYHQT